MKFTAVFILSLFLATTSLFAQVCPENDTDCVGIYFTDATASVGELLCVDVFTCGFKDILSFQFSLSFREDLIAFNSCETDALDGYTCSDLQPESDEPVIKTVWFQAQSSPTTLDSATVLTTLCFDVLQDVDSEGEIISFSDDLRLEIIQGDPDNPSAPLVVKEGCTGGMPSIVMSGDMTSSTNEIFEQSIKLGPNPFDNVISINIDPQLQDDIIVYVNDLAGKNVVRQTMDKSTMALDLSSVANGMYMLVLESKDHGTWVQKIMKSAAQ